MTRNGDVVFATLLGGQAKMAASLTSGLVAKAGESAGEFLPERSRGSLKE